MVEVRFATVVPGALPSLLRLAWRGALDCQHLPPLLETTTILLTSGSGTRMEYLIGHGWINTLTTDLQIQVATDAEDRITDFLGGQPPGLKPPQQFIGWIDPVRIRIHVTGGPVGQACHQETVHGLDAPTTLDHLDGKPVEQLGVRRLLAQDAEIIRRGDEAASKVILPEPVDDDAGCSRVGWIDDPLCKYPATH